MWAMKKTIWVLVVLLVVVIGSGILQSLSLRKKGNRLDKLLHLYIPMELAAREIEVSIWKTANAIFYYMTEPSATSLRGYRKELKDVKEYMNKFKALVKTEMEKRIMAEFEELWTDVVAKGGELLKLRDQMTKLQEKTWGAVHEVDNVIDYKLQAALVEGIPDQLKKEKALREIEVSIWEAFNAINYYVHRQFDKPKREFPIQLEDVNEYWEDYKRLDLDSTEKPHLHEFASNWMVASGLMKETVQLADELKAKYIGFWESVHDAGDVIEFRIQRHLQKGLGQMEP